MASTVFTGWRNVTPGPCMVCGMTDDYDCDGSGNVYCSCQMCAECSEHDGHSSVCSSAPHHYVYGSGSAGCLFDSGPNYAETEAAAIEAALLIFGDLPKAELNRARANLRSDGIHYFRARYRGRAGADLVSVSRESGPCPDNDA